MTLRELMLGSDELAMRRYCIVRFGVDPKMFGLSFHGRKTAYQGDEANLMTIKRALCDYGCFGYGANRENDSSLTTPLHVFFIHLLETEEMLARLPEPEQVEANVARSKIAKTKTAISPINRIASQVTGITPAPEAAPNGPR